MRQPSSSTNGLANFVTFVGIALVVVAGVTAYPSIRGWLGLEPEPAEFGDEQALSASIVESSESLPPGSAPLVLPETPLEIEATLAPTATPQPTATLQPTLQPTSTAEPSPTPSPEGEFAPDVPSRIVIPAIDLDAPVVTVGWSIITQSDGQQVSMWDVPNRRAAGWLKTSALAGATGNTVLDGHHNIAGEVFRDLVNLEAGDAIQVWVGERTRTYVVSLLKILPERGQPLDVRMENAKWIQPTNDERLTLVTCWPYTNNTHRLVVVALPAEAAANQVPPDDSGVE
jgi:sortase A